MKKLLLPSVCLFLAAAASGHAQVLLNEDFESGNLDSWTVTAANPLTISTEQNRIPAGTGSSAKMVNSADRMYTNLNPAVTADSSKFTYYLYDSAPRSYCEARTYADGGYNNGALVQLLAIGKQNNVDPGMPGEVYNGTKYQGRIAFGVGAGWFNLDGVGTPNRSAGWHRFDIVRGLNADSTVSVSFYVDGILSRSFTGFTIPKWDSVILGPGLGSTAGDAWFDGLQVLNGQPYIQAQPQGATNAIGTDTTLSVTATGITLSYQWYKGGALLDGKTDSSLLLSNPQLSDSGNYTVVVTNDLDKATSAVAVVSIVTPLAIIVQPTNSLPLNPGETAQFDVVASSANPISYQWKKGGVNLIEGGIVSGSTSPNLVLTGISTNDAGAYSVEVSDGVNPSVTSSDAFLLVNTPPAVTTANQNAGLGSAFQYSVPVADDFSIISTPFQNFESFLPGARIMFGHAGVSGSTDAFLDTNAPLFTHVSEDLPGQHTSPKALQVTFSYLEGTTLPWIRLTTTGSAVTNTANPTISMTRALRFDMYTDRDIQIGVGIRETSPTGEIGSNGGGTGTIEWIGMENTIPRATRLVPGGVWTPMFFDITNEPVHSAFGGNGVLNSTTGKGVLEHLALISPDGGSFGEFNLYLDNFMVVAENALTFSLNSAPDGATINGATGLISWTPSEIGIHNFEVVTTDSGGLTSTNSFTVNVGASAPPTLNYSVSGSDITLNWTGTFNLQSKTNLSDATWDHVASGSPYTTAMTNAATFYRLEAP